VQLEPRETLEAVCHDDTKCVRMPEHAQLPACRSESESRPSAAAPG
jgi:hypothetical protein